MNFDLSTGLNNELTNIFDAMQSNTIKTDRLLEYGTKRNDIKPKTTSNSFITNNSHFGLLNNLQQANIPNKKKISKRTINL